MSLSKGKCWYCNNCLHFLKCAVPLALNDADTLKFSSILIYSRSGQNIYTEGDWHDGTVIKSESKRRGFNELIQSVNEIMKRILQSNYEF